jgi:LPXTG-site transpeptidase (sortase) family protein
MYNPGMKVNIQKWIGNGLIIASLLTILFLFLPYLLAFLPKKLPPVTVTSDFAITIPKISAHSLIIPEVDPWNVDAYQKALRLGVAQAKGTALPDEKGTMYIFAHSSAPPWEILWHHPDFLRLGELQTGDTITITYKKKIYTYEVYDKKVVWPTDTKYLTRDGTADLILQTCTPVPTAYQRLLVFAKKVY